MSTTSITTLPKCFTARGYRTGGFVGAFVLDRRWGLAQGFDHYFDDFDLSRYDMTAGLDAAQRPGKRSGRSGAGVACRRRRPPVLLAWVHLYDPHSPYTPPEPYRSRFPATMQGAYDGEVAATDAQIGRLLEYLESSDRLDQTIVVVVGDHGESLGEHHEQQHGFFVYDASVHIPLIVAGPGVPARAVPDQVRIVDVMPTILDLAGAEVPAAVQGVSLLPLARGEPLDLLGFSETWYPRYHYGWSELMAVKDGRYKFIAAPRRELYDTQVDPGRDQRHCRRRTRALADALETGAPRHDRSNGGCRDAQRAPAGRSGRGERLRALGYVGDDRHAGGDGRTAARRSERHDRPLQPAEVGGKRFGRRQAGRGHCQGPAGARGRP